MTSGRSCVDERRVDRVQRPPVGNGRPHLAVDLDAVEQARVDPRRRHHRQILDLGRIGALVGAPDERLREAEADDDLRGGGQERDDPHGCAQPSDGSRTAHPRLGGVL